MGFEQRLAHLERQMKRWQFAALLLGVVLALTATMGATLLRDGPPRQGQLVLRAYVTVVTEPPVRHGQVPSDGPEGTTQAQPTDVIQTLLRRLSPSAPYPQLPTTDVVAPATPGAKPRDAARPG